MGGSTISKKKIFKKLINMFKNRRKYIILKKFYLKHIRNGKSVIAIFVDTILIRLVFCLILFSYTYFKTNNFLFSIIIIIQFFILYNLVLYKIYKIRLKKSREVVNFNIGKEKVYKELINKIPYEFYDYIKQALDCINMNKIEFSSEDNIDMIGFIDERKVGIKCYQFTEDYKVSVNDVRKVFLAFKKQNVDEGIIITTSSFMDDVKDFMVKLEQHINIDLYNLEKLVKLIRHTELYPSQKEIKEIILSKISDERRKIKQYQSIVISKSKVIKYMILSALIFFWGRYTPYYLYYCIISYILFILAVISLARYLSELFVSNNKEKNA